LSNAFILTIKSKWKPRFSYNFDLLKEMLSFSMWSLAEAVLVWLTNYIGIFIVGTILSQYYLGLYKTAMVTVSQFTSIITSAFTPIVFSALSRLQNEPKIFKETFLKFQRMTSYLIVPMGMGIFLYRNVITDILLGNQWAEAAGFVGIWGAVSSIKIIYSNYCYEVYRAYGKPKLAVLAQVCQLVVLVPAIYFSARLGFRQLYITRTLVVLELIIVNQLIIHFAFGFSSIEILKNTYSSFVASIIMAIMAIFFQKQSNNIIWSFISIILCMFIYFIVLCIMFPKQRNEIKNICNSVNKKFEIK